MTSRTEKYYTENQTTTSTRSSRNERLYREVYGKYDNSDNLPLEDNTNEIDMAKLKELVLNSSSKQEEKELSQTKEHFSILEQRKRNIDEQKLYDINKILEKAKYENNKLKETTSTLPKIDKSILSTLQSTELSIPEIKEASKKYEMKEEIQLDNKETELEEKLSMTRELKYHNLVEEEPISSATSDLSLDLFSDLKPTGNTIVTKPIKEDSDNRISQTKNYSSDFHSSDTSDIDIIKPAVSSNTKESDFFTSSYEFSKKDFTYDEDFYEDNQKGSILKVILLILVIFIFVGVITYFIINYGIGIS